MVLGLAIVKCGESLLRDEEPQACDYDTRRSNRQAKKEKGAIPREKRDGA
jgi:hypothetical protein